jgi:hypothetical protein
MTTTIKFDFDKYIKICSQNVGYDLERKEQFLKMSRKLAAITAQELGLEQESYDIRVNKAGIAVSGEVTLHGENIYIQFGQGCFNGFLCLALQGSEGLPWAE